MRTLGRILVAGIAVGFAAAPGALASERAVVRHAPVIHGVVTGSVQQLTAEDVEINGGGDLRGDLLVLGTPLVQTAGRARCGGTVDAAGAVEPSGYHVALGGHASVQRVVRRTDPDALPVVGPPHPPCGRDLVINQGDAAPANFSELRNLTLNDGAGTVAVPPGVYGNLTVNGSARLVLGAAGSAGAVRYELQRLTINRNAGLGVVGPVELLVAGDVVLHGAAGSAEHPGWLRLSVAHGGVTLDGGALWAQVRAPDGAVVINGGGSLTGGLACDRLRVNAGGKLCLAAMNQPPSVAMAAPADGASLLALTPLTLEARAVDPDGTIARVEFFNGSAKLGEGLPVVGDPGLNRLTIPGGFPAGTFSLMAVATDDAGASVTSEPVSVSITLSPNQAPQVALVDPADGAALTAGVPVTLSAEASDADGTVTEVEFFDGDFLLGVAASPSAAPSTYTWTAASGLAPGRHVLGVRAVDDDGAFADSAPVAVVVRAGIPYEADFEPAGGYAPGPLDGQLGWVVSQGAATVTAEDAFSGVHAVALAPGDPPPIIGQTFAAAPSQPEILFVDFFAKPVADNPIENAARFDLEGSRFAFLRDGESGRLCVFNGDGTGGGWWLPTEFTAPLAWDQQTQDWIRLTARLDFGRKTWDLYAGGSLVGTDLVFRDQTRAAFTTFGAQGHASATSRLDYLIVTSENPLFADADRDGMDDAWETANGLDPTVDDRNGDRDGDGLSNLREFRLGLNPNNPDTDGDGLYDGDEVVWGWGPLNPNPDTVPPTAPTGLAASVTTDTVSLTWQPATDNLRVSGYLVYRDGQPVATPQPIREARFADSGLPDDERFSYAVRAFDFAGNLSPMSERVTARTIAMDTDGNGLPDHWEDRYFPDGVDPAADADGDGVTNIDEFRNGTDPTDFYNGVLPVHEVLYGGRPGPDDQLAMIVRKPDGTPWPNAPVSFDITSGHRRLSAQPGGPYAYHVDVRADAEGRAQAYLEPLTP